ncbi:MAG: universal stress protein [Brasilonema sp.]
MFHKILAALDASEMGNLVFEQALGLAKKTEASVMLLHVLSAEEEGSPYMPMLSSVDCYPGLGVQNIEFYQKQWDAYETEGLKMLRLRASEALSAGVNAEFTQNLGSPGRIICHLARSWGADLIVIGRRGRSGLTEFLLGSVSNYVLHHAPCSVFVVHRQADVKETEVQTQTSGQVASTN